MKLLDLTHTITEDMPVYPGDPGPRLTPGATVPRDGYRETLLTFCSHTGTHMDAPAHLFGDLSTLDALDVERFAGPAAAVDCTRLPAGAEIGPECLDGLDLERLDFVLFSTGWCRYWGKPEYFAGFPVFSPACVGRLAAAGLKGVGVDAISVDPVDATDLPNHRALLGAGMVIVENLVDIVDILEQTFSFCALPLKFAQADGAPVRAVAVL